MFIKKLGKIDPSQESEAMSIDPSLAGLLCSCPEGEGNYTTIDLPIIVDDKVIKLSVLVNEKALKDNETEVVSFFDKPDFKLIKNKYHALYLFKGNLFHVLASMIDNNTIEEATLSIKKSILSEDTKIRKLRKEVELLEKVSTHNPEKKRSPIPDEVKLFVFNRDEGKCVECGSPENLQFDHIIPVAKGGSSSEENVQLLCQRCNLRKSDNLIA